MILCVSPNPALDRTLVIPHFALGGVFRATQTLLMADGKGANVARAVRILGHKSVCAGFLGGPTGRRVAELAEAEGLASAWTWIDNETRTDTLILDSETGEATVLNEPGPSVSVDDWARLKVDILRQSASADVICLSGSLPPGSPVETYGNLIRALQGAGHRLWIDTSGKALATALSVSGFNLKVNVNEAGAFLGCKVDTLGEAFDAADELRRRGVQNVALTMGARGAVFVTDEGRWFAEPPEVKAVCAVGSGDSFMAGLLTALTMGVDPGEALRRGVAAGAANSLTLGSGSFGREDFEAILHEAAVRAV